MRESEESPGAVGLGIVNQRVQRFGSDVHVPQLGWNTVQPQGERSPFEAGEAYFANSFRLVDPPDGWGHAVTDYGGTFTSSIWRGSRVGVSVPSGVVGRLGTNYFCRTGFRMLKARIIPCLDVKDGRVVKGIKFQNLRDAGDPVELSDYYQQQGADELVLLDVSATREGRLAMLETVEAVPAND